MRGDGFGQAASAVEVGSPAEKALRRQEGAEAHVAVAHGRARRRHLHVAQHLLRGWERGEGGGGAERKGVKSSENNTGEFHGASLRLGSFIFVCFH